MTEVKLTYHIHVYMPPLLVNSPSHALLHSLHTTLFCQDIRRQVESHVHDHAAHHLRHAYKNVVKRVHRAIKKAKQKAGEKARAADSNARNLSAKSHALEKQKMKSVMNVDPLESENGFKDVLLTAQVRVIGGIWHEMDMDPKEFDDGEVMLNAEKKYTAERAERSNSVAKRMGTTKPTKQNSDDVGGIKNFVLTWRDALMKHGIFDDKDITNFISEITAKSDAELETSDKLGSSRGVEPMTKDCGSGKNNSAAATNRRTRKGGKLPRRQSSKAKSIDSDSDDSSDSEAEATSETSQIRCFRAVVESEYDHNESDDAPPSPQQQFDRNAATRQKIDKAAKKYNVDDVKASEIYSEYFGFDDIGEEKASELSDYSLSNSKTKPGMSKNSPGRVRAASQVNRLKLAEEVKKRKDSGCPRCTAHDIKPGNGEICSLCRKTELVRSRFLSLLKVSIDT
jgi:hypothetical protein